MDSSKCLARLRFLKISGGHAQWALPNGQYPLPIAVATYVWPMCPCACMSVRLSVCVPLCLLYVCVCLCTYIMCVCVSTLSVLVDSGQKSRGSCKNNSTRPTGATSQQTTTLQQTLGGGNNTLSSPTCGLFISFQYLDRLSMMTSPIRIVKYHQQSIYKIIEN